MRFRHPSNKASKTITILSILLWCGLSAAGFVGLAIYSLTPGMVGMPPHRDQLDLPLQLPKDQHVLVMVIHPQCPCSHASLKELERIISTTKDDLYTLVLAYHPANAKSDWLNTPLVDKARSLPNVHLVADYEANYASQIRMSTSGSVVFYDREGVARFFGGITVARNHEGENHGSDSVIALLNHKQPKAKQSPVFGCPIHSENPICNTNESLCDEKETR